MTERSTPTRESVTITDHTREASDGTSLALRVIRPTDDEPVPVLLQRTPYERPEFPLDDLPMAALRRGYAIVYEDVRGRGESDGTFTPWVHEAVDGQSAVEWVANRPWSSGNVGMFGSSSPGQVQLLAAAERPSGLEAIAPMFSPSDLHRADFFQDGTMSALTLISWSFGWVAPHTISRLKRQNTLADDVASSAREACEEAVANIRTFASSRPLVNLPDRVFADISLPSEVTPDVLVPHWSDWVTNPTYNAFWQSFDPERHYDRMDVPGLHITGWFELCQHGTVTNYRGMSHNTTRDQHLIVGPWSHQETTSTIGDVDFGNSASAESYGLNETHLDFFDTYVRNEPTGRFAREANIVETFRLDPDGGSWQQHETWPPERMSIDRYYLHTGDTTNLPLNQLSPEPPVKGAAASTYKHDPHDPVPTRGGPLCCDPNVAASGMFDQSVYDERNDVLSFTTEPFTRQAEFAGPVSASLVVSTTANGADFATKLVHMTKDGRAYNLCEGIQRCRYRHGRDKPISVPSGDPMRITIDMWYVHHQVSVGDRLRLYISSSNFPRFDPNPGTEHPWITSENNVRSAKQTVFHETGRQSYVELPRIQIAK